MLGGKRVKNMAFDDKKVPMTYRCDSDLAVRIKAIKDITGWSFQKLTDEFYKTLLYKCQTESVYFKDLTITKKIEYTVGDILAIPSIRNIFGQRKT